MKRRLLLLLLFGIVVLVASVARTLASPTPKMLGSQTAHSYAGGLEVWFEGNRIEGNAIFSVTNMLPLDCETRTVELRNTGSQSVVARMRSLNSSETLGFSQILDIVVSLNSADIYGGSLGAKTLAQFWVDSASPNWLELTTLPAGGTALQTIKVCMPNVGNEYQLASAKFDLKWNGEHVGPTPSPTPKKTPTPRLSPTPSISLPPECSHLAGIITNVIEGTDGPNVIEGTSASELILGKGGADVLLGANGDDCIVGGSGSDKLNGGNGQDMLIAGEGDDVLVGGNGEDIAYGGAGKDVIDTGNGDDRLYGEAGQDTLDAGPGDDYLDGGTEHDGLNGKSGTDTCVNGELNSSCEL